MFDPERLYRSWALVNAALQVLRANRQLIVFPIVSGILSLLVTLTFVLPTLLHGGFFAHDTHVTLNWLGVFAYYVAQYAVVFFANAALIGAAILCLRGRTPTAADGFRLAIHQIGAILGYAVIATTVGTLLCMQRRRLNVLGRLIIDLYGLAWNLATYLVAPVIIAEKLGPVAAVKRSAELLQHTWGEQIIGNVGIGAIFSWITMLVLLPIIVLAYFSFHHDSDSLRIATVLLLVLSLSLLSVIQSALSGIYTAAVYLYAADDFIVDPFDADLVRDAFRTR